MVTLVILLLLLILLSVGIGSWMVWDDVKDEHKPYFWDDSKRGLTEEQQIKMFERTADRRIQRIMTEIDHSRREHHG